MIHELPLRLNLLRRPVPNRTHYHSRKCTTLLVKDSLHAHFSCNLHQNMK